jgi:hypothetical protein
MISIPKNKSTYAYGVFILILILSGGVLAVDSPRIIGSDDATNPSIIKQQSQLPLDQRDSIAPKTTNTTIVSSQKGFLVAFLPNGRVGYYTDKMDAYWDIDPISDDSKTILVVGTEAVGDNKQQNVIKKINISTGVTQTIYKRNFPDTGTVRWHDVDYIGNKKYVIADIARDSMFILDNSDNSITYRWSMYNAFSIESGGEYPNDWTHMNDVEMIQDANLINDTIFMLSPRNHDQVIFVSRDEGLYTNLTIGEDDNYQVMYEQHNPDYIHSERGGPAVIIADSQNNRIIEYQMENNNWSKSWEYSDSKMRWPRDADRLPNGNTLIADSNSDRVLEINQSGEVIWQASVTLNYDIERLRTGDESATGESAEYLNLSSSTKTRSQVTTSSPIVTVKQLVDRGSANLLSLLPSKVENAIRFSAPGWMGSAGMLASIIFLSDILLLILISAYYSSYTLRITVTRN